MYQIPPPTNYIFLRSAIIILSFEHIKSWNFQNFNFGLEYLLMEANIAQRGHVGNTKGERMIFIRTQLLSCVTGMPRNKKRRCTIAAMQARS